MPRKLNFNLEPEPESSDIRNTVNKFISNPKNNRKKKTAEKSSLSLTEKNLLKDVNSTSYLNPSVNSVIVVEQTLKEIKEPDNSTNASLQSDYFEQQLLKIGTSHNEREHKVYEAMYRNTILEDRTDRYFSISKLLEITGYDNPRTISAAIEGLVQKKSIKILINEPGLRFGKRFRVFAPNEIIERRKKAKIEIDPDSKEVFKKN